MVGRLIQAEEVASAKVLWQEHVCIVEKQKCSEQREAGSGRVRRGGHAPEHGGPLRS